MAFGYFEVDRPGLTYSNRLSYVADPTTLPVDPDNAASALEGEWVVVDAANHIIRPSDTTTPTAAAALLAFPLLVDRSRTDIQSNQGKLSVLAHKGAICRTSTYATLEGDDSTAITYAAGDTLTFAEFLDADLRTRVGLVPDATAANAPTTVFGGTVAGALSSAAAAGYGARIVARVLRPPYTLSGVGVGSRRQVIDLVIE